MKPALEPQGPAPCRGPGGRRGDGGFARRRGPLRRRCSDAGSSSTARPAGPPGICRGAAPARAALPRVPERGGDRADARTLDAHPGTARSTVRVHGPGRRALGAGARCGGTLSRMLGFRVPSRPRGLSARKVARHRILLTGCVRVPGTLRSRATGSCATAPPTGRCESAACACVFPAVASTCSGSPPWTRVATWAPRAGPCGCAAATAPPADPGPRSWVESRTRRSACAGPAHGQAPPRWPDTGSSATACRSGSCGAGRECHQSRPGYHLPLLGRGRGHARGHGTTGQRARRHDRDAAADPGEGARLPARDHGRELPGPPAQLPPHRHPLPHLLRMPSQRRDDCSGAEDPLVTGWAQLRRIQVMPRFDCQNADTLNKILTDPAIRARTIDTLVNLASGTDTTASTSTSNPATRTTGKRSPTSWRTSAAGCTRSGRRSRSRCPPSSGPPPPVAPASTAIRLWRPSPTTCS